MGDLLTPIRIGSTIRVRWFNALHSPWGNGPWRLEGELRGKFHEAQGVVVRFERIEEGFEFRYNVVLRDEEGPALTFAVANIVEVLRCP